ncbi:tetratricopeptide repeat protein [Nonomuraea maritima]|uniref:tetratricopeptide repeat protein n=1 Tax=Nonomuraea maritima TaxID=683260 RepID=UPI003722B885
MPHEHPQGPHNAGPDPTPDTVQTPADLAAALDALRRARGLSYSDLEKAARPDSLPASTVSDLLKKGRPSQEKLEVFLRACGIPREQQHGWLKARERALSSSLAGPGGAVRVVQASARDFGVHKPIVVDGATGELPVYVQRDTDTAPGGVRDLLVRAMERGGLVVLVGESSAGKTRCAFEAVATLMPQWWLLHPSGSAQLTNLAADPPPRTVVWLDELQNYLDGERGLTPAVLRSLTQSGMVLVATLWPDRYTSYTRLPDTDGTDPYRVEREVLKLAEVVHIPAVLSPGELERAREAAKADPRVALALESTDYGMTQVIAAAPQLVNRWHAADPYAAAVLTAAVDAARLGARAPLSAELLRAAAPGYCDHRQRATAPPNWFETALAYATDPVHGAAAALAPVATEMGQPAGYQLADYLLQYAGSLRRTAKAPARLWQALADHVTDPADHIRLADSAMNRLLRRYAEPLYRNAAQVGDVRAALRLADLLAEQGQVEEALELLRARADAENRFPADRLAWLLAKHGRVEELRARADAGDGSAAYQLAKLLAKQGQVEEALELLQAQVDAGNSLSAIQLAMLLGEQGQVEEALELLRARADAGDGRAITELHDLLAKHGRVEELRARADAGSVTAAYQLAMLLGGQGQVEEALELLRAQTDAGSVTAAIQLAMLLSEQGQVEEALELLRAQIDAGNSFVTYWLDDLLAKHDRVEELRARADAGDGRAATRMASLLANRGQVEEALELLRARADTGDGDAADRLAALLATQGQVEELRARADAGDGAAARYLATALNWAGRKEEADLVWRFGLSADE